VTKLLRNREIQQFLLIVSGLSLLLTGIAAYFSLQTAIFVWISSLLFISCNLIFTKWRYRELEKLSGDLRRISNGDFSLDVRDNYEGELSILKSDIYKMTIMLSEHGSLLQEEKIKLTNAISDISHQLKTPLTSLMVMTDLLSNPHLQESKRKEFTHNISIQIERMEWLVSSLLKLSKIDAGTVPFKKDKIYVYTLIDKAIQPILIPMDIKQQTLKVSGETSVSFVGDLNWTAEAILNILKNCIEHTEEGGEIEISYSENPLFTEITIQDNGEGIEKEDLPYIFKRFYKGKNAGEESVGIGLAMAQSIIKSQKGMIDVSSKKNEGTRFHIKLYKQVI
jgi:signal transduction histidine kinase